MLSKYDFKIRGIDMMIDKKLSLVFFFINVIVVLLMGIVVNYF